MCFIALLPIGKALAMEPIMTTEQLTPGMYGYAKTVIEGTTIETFDVEIVGIIKDGSDSEGKILAKASGDVIERSGGVLQGMSGSPVYVDGYLIGAISGGWKDINNRLCIITPIADMMEIWNMPDTKSTHKIKQVDLKAIMAKKAEQEVLAKEKAEAEKNQLIDENNTKKENDVSAEKNSVPSKEIVKTETIAEEKATPLMAAGFTDAAMEMLTQKLQPFGIVPYASNGTSDGSSTPVTIEPGSSVAAQIVRGDISMAAIGTVTAVDGNRVLAFGHPFLRKGNVSYFMTDANIISTASGVNTGFKIGVPGNPVGMINQDRTNGIAGVLGMYPQVVPLQVKVTDKQIGIEQTYGMQIAYNEDILPALVATMVYNAIDKTMDRAGEGTIRLGFEIMTNAVPDGMIKRENMFFNVQNVAQLSINEIGEMMNILCSNTIREVDILSVKVHVEIDQTRKTASIIQVQPSKPQVKAGETVELTVKLKPYRAEEVSIVVPYTVPKHQQPGNVMLEVRGGGLVPLTQMMMLQQTIDLSAEEDKTKTIEMSVKEFLDKNKNNEIVVDTVMPQEDPTKIENKKVGKTKQQNQGVNKGEKVPAQLEATKHETEYIIDNVMRIPLMVEETK